MKIQQKKLNFLQKKLTENNSDEAKYELRSKIKAVKEKLISEQVRQIELVHHIEESNKNIDAVLDVLKVNLFLFK